VVLTIKKTTRRVHRITIYAAGGEGQPSLFSPDSPASADAAEKYVSKQQDDLIVSDADICVQAGAYSLEIARRRASPRKT